MKHPPGVRGGRDERGEELAKAARGRRGWRWRRNSVVRARRKEAIKQDSWHAVMLKTKITWPLKLVKQTRACTTHSHSVNKNLQDNISTDYCTTLQWQVTWIMWRSTAIVHVSLLIKPSRVSQTEEVRWMTGRWEEETWVLGGRREKNEGEARKKRATRASEQSTELQQLESRLSLQRCPGKRNHGCLWPPQVHPCR